MFPCFNARASAFDPALASRHDFNVVPVARACHISLYYRYILGKSFCAIEDEIQSGIPLDLELF
jgi:hypothetical protein